MATDSRDETVRVQRQTTMGSDEHAMEGRRQIQKLIRDGEESAVPELIEHLCNHLAQPSSRTELAAMASARGLGQLCNVGDATPYPGAAQGETRTAEEALVIALQAGSNRLQCSAADALGQVGTPSVRTYLEARSTGDRSARVRARAKIALRRLDLRGGQALGCPQTVEALRALIEKACEPVEFVFKPAEKKGEFKESEAVPNLFEVKVELSAGRTQTVSIKTGESHSDGGNTNTVGLEDDRGVAPGLTVHSRYVVFYTYCGPAKPAIYERVLKINSVRLSPQSFKQLPYGFSKGSLGIHVNPMTAKPELCMLETLPVDSLSVVSIRHAVKVLAVVGDELEKILAGKDEQGDKTDER
jgi:hypothetical protein